MLDRGFCDFMEDYSSGAGLVEAEGLREMPGDRLPFAVFIGCEPYGLRSGRRLLEFGHYFLLVGRHHVLRPETVFDVDAELVVLQVAYMSEAGFHHIAVAKELLDCLCLGGRFHDN